MKDFQSIPKNQIFTREQLRAIRGGDDGYYGGGGGNYQCCPGAGSGGIGCSGCYYYSTTPSCTMGNLTKC